ncbi:histidine phosphatase family protein [Desulforhopalus vacuolatus]|uniref:SixA phosphatase family protein n=1 Tax=Desulforhopalus vacuolatus TaxID=40414 RepID=UPI0019630B07|nr:histidine phosphatase family protein [Desulforhopalus vacuolatus]MBM9519895.1 histidine phosphatase family protein [Desulforhopalus vacuolatus]
MKKIFLVRHAKSSGSFPELKDIERPLSKRGTLDAREMSGRLAARKVQVDCIITGPARRARKTAKWMAVALGIDKKNIIVKKKLYPGEAGELREVLKDQLKKNDNVLLVGHNPGLSDFAEELGGKSLHEMPTSAVAALEVKNKDATALKKSCAHIAFYDFPQNRKH